MRFRYSAETGRPIYTGRMNKRDVNKLRLLTEPTHILGCAAQSQFHHRPETQNIMKCCIKVMVVCVYEGSKLII